jgi:hypothetical protein|tara:strand:+ start:2028 stop:3677 length:1650 start_codon:yes stop_codon:yes gene_type:complete
MQHAGTIKNTITNYVLVGVLFFSIFLFFQLATNEFWSVADPFYHTKHSMLMLETRDFTQVAPWITTHFLGYAPNDPWWGYHVLLAISIYFFGPILGMKVLTALFAALVALVFYGILRSFKIKHALAWTALFMFSSMSFLYRLNLERPLLLAMSLMPLAYFFAIRKKYIWLFALSFVYTLLYNLAPLVLVIIVIHTAVEYYYTRILNLKPIIASGAGILCGIIIHPHSLNYLYVMYIHIWQVPYLKLTGVSVDAISELRTPKAYEFIVYNALVLVFSIISWAIIAGTLIKRKKNQAYIVQSLGIISLAWMIVSIVMVRGVEYWIPFAWLFIVLAFYQPQAKKIWKSIPDYIKNNKLIQALVIGCVGLILGINIFFTYQLTVTKSEDQEFTYSFKTANEWLKENTPQQSVIFYNNWSYWPIMFFNNHHNRYTTGMAPVFLYEYNKELFWIWKSITEYGIYCNTTDFCPSMSPKEQITMVGPTIQTMFNSNYILLENNPEQWLFKVLENQKNQFSKVYENEIVIIFAINELGNVLSKKDQKEYAAELEPSAP